MNEMTVIRIESGDGSSHVEPPLDESWSEAQKLEWRAAVIRFDTGLDVHVRVGGLKTERQGIWREVPNFYSISYPRGGSGMGSFAEAWSYLNGIELGHHLTVS